MRPSRDSLPAELVGRLQRAAAELDAAAVARRRRRAEADPHVSLRPAPDVMTWLGALLPVESRRRRARGPPPCGTVSQGRRRPAQHRTAMADLLVQRVVHPGLAAAAAPEIVAPSTVSTVPVMINVIVRDSVLLGDQDGTGWVNWSRPCSRRPDPWMAGRQSRHRSQHLAPSALRTARHRQPGGHGLQRRAVRGSAPPSSSRLRDRICRTVGCDAPIRHADHVVPSGPWWDPPAACNGQGLC